MSTITRNTATPRAADIWGLALAAARQQKVRTALTIIGVVVGTFTLVVSLSVGQGVERAIVALFHEDDRLRKVVVHTKYQPSAEDVPESEREPRGPMSEAKRERIRRALVRNWRGVSHRDRRIRLDAAALRRIEALDHVVRVEPVVQGFGTATLGREEPRCERMLGSDGQSISGRSPAGGAALQAWRRPRGDRARVSPLSMGPDRRP